MEEVTENVEPTTEEKVEKTFTQSEFVKALEKEVARKTKGLPSKEELDEFAKWKESNKSAEDKFLEAQRTIDALNLQVKEYEKREVVANADVDPKFQKFVTSEVSQMEGVFEDNLNKYLEDNPQYKFQKETKIISTGIPQKTNEVINEEKAYLDRKYANNPYYRK